MTGAGIEPAISSTEVRWLYHCATAPLIWLSTKSLENISRLSLFHTFHTSRSGVSCSKRSLLILTPITVNLICDKGYWMDQFASVSNLRKNIMLRNFVLRRCFFSIWMFVNKHLSSKMLQDVHKTSIRCPRRSIKIYFKGWHFGGNLI